MSRTPSIKEIAPPPTDPPEAWSSYLESEAEKALAEGYRYMRYRSGGSIVTITLRKPPRRSRPATRSSEREGGTDPWRAV